MVLVGPMENNHCLTVLDASIPNDLVCNSYTKATYCSHLGLSALMRSKQCILPSSEDHHRSLKVVGYSGD